MRTRAWRRSQRKRIIAKRIAIIQAKWYMPLDNQWFPFQYFRGKYGKLAKFNLVCSCDMCRAPKYRDTRLRRSAADQLALNEECASSSLAGGT